MKKNAYIILNTIIVCLLFLGMQEHVRIIIDKCFLPIVSIKQHWAIDSLFIVVGLVGLWDVKNKKIIFSSLDLSVLFIMFFSYTYYRWDEQVYVFTRLGHTSITYIDIIAILMLLHVWIYLKGILISLTPLFIKRWVIKKRIGVRFVNYLRKLCRKRNNNKTIGYIPQEDNPIQCISKDKFGMEEHVQRVISYIETVDVSQKAFSLGIVANWGYGKSSFFYFLKERIRDNKDFLILDFNPRSSKDINHIQEDFLNGLREALQPLHLNLTRVFQDYARALNISIDASPVLLFFQNAFKLHEKNRDDSYEKINNIIKGTNRRIVVFVDDLDRLTAKELLEVMKVIDKNGAFANVIFVSAYDKEYVNDALKSYLKHEVKCPYTDKYFDLEIKLPKHASYLMINYLQELIVQASARRHIAISQHSIVTGISQMKDCIQKRLVTIRDVKRFVNQFLYDYPTVQHDVSFNDYFMLELMKFSHKEEYDNLRDLEYVESSYDIDKEDDIYYLKPWLLNSSSVNVKSLDILTKLFPVKERVLSVHANRNGRIHSTSFFDIYFYNNEYNHLLQKDFKLLYEIPLEEKCEKLETWLNSKGKNLPHASDLKTYILSRRIINIGNKEMLRSYFQMLMYLYYLTNSYDYLNQLNDFFEKKKVNDLLKIHKFKNKRYYLQWIRESLYDFFKYRPLVASLLYPELVNNCLTVENKDSYYCCTCEDLQQEARALFNNYMHGIEESDWKAEIAFALSDINDQDSEHFYIPIMTELFEWMVDAPHKFYPALFPVVIQSGDKKCLSFNLHFHLKAVFKDLKRFDEILSAQKSSNSENIHTIKKFYELYKRNNYEPIEFQENSISVTEIVDKLSCQLGELQQIANKLNFLRKEWHRKKRVKYIESFIQRIDLVRVEFSKTTLQISYADKLKSKIDSLYRYIRNYEMDVVSHPQNLEKEDLIRLNDNWLTFIGSKEEINKKVNIFRIEKFLSNNMVKLYGVMEEIPKVALNAIPIDGKSDRYICYKSTFSLSYYHSYYMDHFKNSSYNINQSIYDAMKEHDFEFVHEVQHWLRSENRGDLDKM